MQKLSWRVKKWSQPLFSYLSRCKGDLDHKQTGVSQFKGYLSHYKMIWVSEEVVTITLKVISATIKMIWATEEVITATF